jgi:hypothetical protein
MNSHDKPKKDQLSIDNDREMDKLEAMWDRQIMKGDDEFFESRIPSRSHQSKSDLGEKTDAVKQQKRRGRKM